MNFESYARLRASFKKVQANIKSLEMLLENYDETSTALKGQIISDMPFSFGDNESNVERSVLEKERIEKEMHNMRVEAQHLKSTMEHIEADLTCIKYLDKKIIDLYFFRGVQGRWSAIQRQLEDETKEQLSIQSIKKVVRRAKRGELN